MAWVLTDDFTMQHARKLDGQCWQLIEMAQYGWDEDDPADQKYQVYVDTVNVEYYIDKERENLKWILSVFGYPSIEFVLKEYQGYHGYQIMAECIFEHYNTEYAQRLFLGSHDECAAFIKNYVKETNTIWYCADYDNDTESEYFTAKTDDEAIEIAKGMDTVVYADIGKVKRSLVQLLEVDDNTECFNEIRMVWG